MRTPPVLTAALHAVEGAAFLDPVAEALSNVLRRAIRPGPIEDVLSGTPTGHPAHPPLVIVPIGAWASASVLDATGRNRDAARLLVAFGCAAAVPAAAAGASDWLSTAGAERRVGMAHATGNTIALTLYALSWKRRRAGHHLAGAALAAVGATVLTASGWLGGHLAYSQAVGVDTTAFQKLPTEWTDALAEADAPAAEGALVAGEADGVPVLIARRDGRLVALADRCTHRGGPLHEGSVRAGELTCPWHGSTFCLDDGAVLSGPATHPQPVLETRVVAGRVQVRRDEERTLRTNPVGR